MTHPFPYYPDRTWKGSVNYSAGVGDPGRFLWTFAWGNPSRLLKKHVHREWHCSWEISDPRNSLGNFTTQVWCMLVMDFTHVTNITPSRSYLHAQGRPLCCFFLLHAIKHRGGFVCFVFFGLLHSVFWEALILCLSAFILCWVVVCSVNIICLSILLLADIWVVSGCFNYKVLVNIF